MIFEDTRVWETIIVFILFVAVRYALIKSIDKTVSNKLLQKTRGKIIKKVVQIVLLVVFVALLLTMWGVERSEAYMFMASVLTVIGIALFAQWSHLSNITSGIILFFYHSVKLDDTIIIMDKEYEIEGRISDVGLFFTKIKTDGGEEVLLPNNVFLQKMIKKKAS